MCRTKWRTKQRPTQLDYSSPNWNKTFHTSVSLTRHTLSRWFRFCRHRGLDVAAECPRYIVMSGGARRGCNFTESSLPDFTDINLCVNGSSPEGPLRPKFMSVQIQNHGTLTPLHTFETLTGGKAHTSAFLLLTSLFSFTVCILFLCLYHIIYLCYNLCIALKTLCC